MLWKQKRTPVDPSQEIKNLAKQIAREQIAPQATERDTTGDFPGECLGIVGEARRIGALIPEVEGGSGIGRPVYASIVQELAGACASTALVYVSHSIAAKALDLYATKPRRRNGGIE